MPPRGGWQAAEAERRLEPSARAENVNDKMSRESHKSIERAKKIGAMSMEQQRAYLESEKRREPESDSADCAPRTGSARPSKCPQCGESIVQTNLGNGQTDDYCEDCGWPDENRALAACKPTAEWGNSIPMISREKDRSLTIKEVDWLKLPAWIEQIQTDAIVSQSPNAELKHGEKNL